MKTSSLEILEKTQLPPEQARAILQVMESELASHDELLATKADMIDGFHRLELKIEAQRAELIDGLHGHDLSLHRLELKIEAQRADLISEIKGTVRWNFAFWIAQLAAIAGILKLLK